MKARDSEGESANVDEPKPMPAAPVQKQAIKGKRPPKSDAVDPIPPNPPPQPAHEPQTGADPVVPDQNSG